MGDLLLDQGQSRGVQKSKSKEMGSIPRTCMCSGASVMLRGVSSRVCSFGAASRQRMASFTKSGHEVL